jgi:hypothetical protein
MNKIDFVCLCFLIVNLKCIIVFGSKIDSSFQNLSIRRTLDNKSIRERETPLDSATQTAYPSTQEEYSTTQEEYSTTQEEYSTTQDSSTVRTRPITSNRPTTREWITTTPTTIMTVSTIATMTVPTMATMTIRPKPTQYSHLLKLIFNLKIEIDE